MVHTGEPRFPLCSLGLCGKIEFVKLRCPICRTPTLRETHTEFPFCSARCRTHDLGNWAMEKYSVSEPALGSDTDEAASDTISSDPDESTE